MENVKVEFYTTSEFTKRLGVQPDTARRGLCLDGHYLGIRPRKLPNGHLRWPVEATEAVLQGREG